MDKSSLSVDLVMNELPHEQVTLISEYSGCISFFIFLFYKSVLSLIENIAQA